MIFIIDQYYLTIAFLICLGWQICFFIVASITKSDKVTDFAYGTNFAGLGAILFAVGQVYSARNIIVLTFLILWGFRLALYLLARVIKEGKDSRFDDTRDNFFKFAAFWALQCCTVWIISIPHTLLYSLPLAPELGWQDGIGIGLWVIGITIETIADFQKFHFKNQPENRKRMCTIGLWRYSRHPNYFGELLCWWGIWALCTRAYDFNGNLWFYWSVVGPLYLGTILIFGSGIPTLEKPWNDKYGTERSFREYKESVPPLIMFPPAGYRRFPSFLRFAACCEFPLYWKNYPSEADVQAEENDEEKQHHSGEALEKTWESSSHEVLYQGGGGKKKSSEVSS